MSKVSNKFRAMLLVAGLVLSIGSLAYGDQLYAYPTKDNPSFSVSAPDDWELTAASEETEGFFDLNGPTGAVLSFRSIEGNQETLEAAVVEAIEYLGGVYDNVKVGDPQESSMGGLPALLATGNGVSKEDGSQVRFVMAWAAMKNGQIAELWFVTTVDDKAGSKQAEGIVNSFKSY